jgi:hypothetical protein
MLILWLLWLTFDLILTKKRKKGYFGFFGCFLGKITKIEIFQNAYTQAVSR